MTVRDGQTTEFRVPRRAPASASFARAGRHARPTVLWRGRVTDPRWVRPALLALLVGTAVRVDGLLGLHHRRQAARGAALSTDAVLAAPGAAALTEPSCR